MAGFDITKILNKQTTAQTENAVTEDFEEIKLDYGKIMITGKNKYSMNDIEDLAAETLPPGDVGREVTQEEEQRFAVASDLANVCEYLEDSEVIKIRLIVNKAQARKDRAEKGDEK